jgi:hypothetical protein
MTLPASFLRHVLASGSAASVLSTFTLAGLGRRETPGAAAPINAISHWIHGDRAYRKDEPDLRHTGLGLAIHQASSLFWGALYEALLRLRSAPGADAPRATTVRARSSAGPGARRPPVGELLALAAGVTAIAAYTDLRLVPQRLSPGFEHRLRPASVGLVYLAFCGGLALGAVLSRRA